MSKGIRIGIIIVLLLAAAYWWFDNYFGECPPVRNPKKFPQGWDEQNRNSGELNRLAQQYADPLLGGDTNYNGSVVGGFFKGIDVYPSKEAAQYYKPYLIKYLSGRNALPWWNIEKGELLCKTA